MTEIIILRHFPTFLNEQHRIQGQCDDEDTQISLPHAQHVIDKLDRSLFKHFDYAMLSSLKRTRETYNILVDQFNMEVDRVIIDSRLIERNQGEFEKMPIEEVVTKIEKKYHYSLPKRMEVTYASDIGQIIDSPGFRPKGGETIEEVKTRAKEFLNDIAQKYTDKKILVITHAGWMKSIGLNSQTVCKMLLKS